MPHQLDILALEPFFGGARRLMLETLIRGSRHRWTLLKLPPRRIERRLTAAANWFGEQLSRHWSGRMDLLLTSEAMNLANLYRLLPALAKHPSVVYFHDNQLPPPGVDGGALELVNLNTATTGTEIWFNSVCHLRGFLERASALVDRHPELSSHNPMAQIASKAHLMPPPIDFSAIAEQRASPKRRPPDPRAIFVETRDADVPLLNESLRQLQDRGEKFRLITVGPAEMLWSGFERRTISEIDDAGQIAGLLEAGIFLSVKPDANFDLQAIRAISAGCQPLLPDGGVYNEILPLSMQSAGLHQGDPSAIAQQLYLMLRTPDAEIFSADVRQALRPYEALIACRAFDDRLRVLVDAAQSRA